MGRVTVGTDTPEKSICIWHLPSQRGTTCIYILKRNVIRSRRSIKNVSKKDYIISGYCMIKGVRIGTAAAA